MELKASWNAAILEAGLLDLSNISTFVIIRLYEIGEIKVEAEGRHGFELVDWAEGPIAVIRDARKIRITGSGKIVGSFVSYEMI